MKKKTKILAIALGTGSLLVGGAAVAKATMAPGEMTRDAVIAKVDERFAKMDANGDGAVSEEEFLAAREARMEQRKERREARAERRGGERMGRRGGRGQRGGMHMLKRADTNQDGQVTKAELQTAALARFDKADANGDGTVTREERKAAREAMRAERGQRSAR